MQYKVLYTVFALVGAAAAQDFSNVPKCAMAPALAAFGKTGCAITNIKCLCSSTSLVPALESAVAAACSASELAQVNAFAISTCKAAGVTLVIPSASSGVAASTGAPSASGNSSSIPASLTSPVISSASTTMSMSSTSFGTSSASTSGGSAAATGSTTTSASQSSSSSPSATASTGAGNVLQVGSSALTGIFLFALAL